MYCQYIAQGSSNTPSPTPTINLVRGRAAELHSSWLLVSASLIAQPVNSTSKIIEVRHFINEQRSQRL